MTFAAWMTAKGLSASSIEKYASSISGPLTTWAQQHQLSSTSLLDSRDSSSFAELAAQIRQLPIFIERNSKGKGMYEAALKQFAAYLAERPEVCVEQDLQTILQEHAQSVTDQLSLIKTRLGQGLFRQKLLAYWGACAVTGYSDPALLVASHIKPWAQANNHERLDPFNGLLLLANLDKAFDAGLISFSPGGQIMLSAQLLEPTSLGIHPAMRVNLAPEHEHYMAYHREQVFQE
jgi:putative restriction endonuclease